MLICGNPWDRICCLGEFRCGLCAAAGLANNIAWVLATCPEAKFRNGRRAVELATQVCAATGNQVPALLDSLAAAYAEAGDFDNAVRTATRALELTRRDAASSAPAIEARLRLYKAGRPYREGGAPPP